MKVKLGMSGHLPVATSKPLILFEQKTDIANLEINGAGHVGHVIGIGEIRGRDSGRSYSIPLGKRIEIWSLGYTKEGQL